MHPHFLPLSPSCNAALPTVAASKGYCHTHQTHSTDTPSSVPYRRKYPRLGADRAGVTPPWPQTSPVCGAQGMQQEAGITLKVFILHSKDGKSKRDCHTQLVIWKIWKVQKNYENNAMNVCPSSSPIKCSRLSTFSLPLLFFLSLSPLLLLLLLLCLSLTCMFTHFNFFCWTIWILLAGIMIVCPKILHMDLLRTRKWKYSPI